MSLSGQVLDAREQPLPYANIILLGQTNQEMITGTTTDEEGLFRMKNIKPDSYIIRISFIGYTDQELQLDLREDRILDPVKMTEEAETLSEVEITVKKPTLTRQPDRLVFNVQSTALSEGNMMEVVKRTPGILVLGESITVKNATPEFYINDRKVNLSSSDLLQLLEGTAASAIQSVEVITNPSARYDADSGIIVNIVMTKNLVTGYQGSVFGNYIQGVFPKYSGGTTQFLKNKNTSFFLNYNYNHRKINRDNEGFVIYPDDTWTSDINRNTWSQTHTVNFNFDVDFNEYNRLSISSNMQFLPYFKYLTKSRTEITPPTSQPFAFFNATNLSRDLRHNMGFNLDYVHTFKADNSKLMFNAHTTLYDYRRNQEVVNDYFREDGQFRESNAFKTRADQNTSIYTGQIDYSLPFKESGSFEAGAKYSKVFTESGLVQRIIENGFEIIDLDNSDMFDYDEQVYAGYVTFRKEIGDWDLSGGVRAEQTEVEAISASMTNNNTQSYLEWFPNGSIGYKINDNTSLYANYKRSIRRPDFRNLNPFEFFLNDNTVVVGNPALQPVFINNYAVGGSIGKHNFEVYFRQEDGKIFELPVQDNDENIIRYTPINFDVTYELGFDYIINFNIIENWNLGFLSSIYYTKDRIGWLNNQETEQDIWAWYGDLTNNFSLLKDRSLDITFGLTYITDNIQGLRRVDSMIFSTIDVSKSILKGRGAITLGLEDLFNESDFSVRTNFLDQNSSNFSNLDNRLFKLGFRYSFGNTKLSTTDADLDFDERKRLGERN
ncbi:MAG: TonB-dependent receptor [Bacteroidia bacterium]|nr:TonB-dependent receptor [Bacteroidia bacterium]